MRPALIVGTTLFILMPTLCRADFKYIPATGDSVSSEALPATPSVPPSVNLRQMPPQSPPSGGPELAPGEGTIVEGFGTQLPLVMAIREIVPSSYQFAFADGLKLGVLVNWKGGAPWHDVLNSVLASHGLIARDGGSVIYIEKAQ
jgi:hypothetical protein